MQIVSITAGLPLSERELESGLQGESVVEIVIDEFPVGTDHIRIVCGGFRATDRVIPVPPEEEGEDDEF